MSSGALNLSDWALRHRALVGFLMVIIVFAGLFSYRNLGRNEDPAFTIKTMVVQAGWPGATVEDTLKQVTDRIERKLQETRDLDFIPSYTTAGRTTVFVNLLGSTRSAEVPGIWYQVRKKMDDIHGHAARRRRGPGLQR